MINPYYYPENLGLKLKSFDDPDALYQYNTICFWITPKGHVYYAEDSGCSCPTPFEEQCSSNDLKEFQRTTTRVNSMQKALEFFRGWNRWGLDEYDLKEFLKGCF